MCGSDGSPGRRPSAELRRWSTWGATLTAPANGVFRADPAPAAAHRATAMSCHRTIRAHLPAKRRPGPPWNRQHSARGTGPKRPEPGDPGRIGWRMALTGAVAPRQRTSGKGARKPDRAGLPPAADPVPPAAGPPHAAESDGPKL